MSFWVAGAVVVGSVVSADSARKAGHEAADAQKDAAREAMSVQERQLEEMRDILKPWVDQGKEAVTAQGGMLGLGKDGAAEQQKAIDSITNGPLFSAMAKQGEDAMLQNASATGGLRGGNIQGALAQYRPQLLNQLLQQQFGNLGQLSTIGENAAAGVGNAGMQAGANIGNQWTQYGAAQAGGELAAGKAKGDMISGITSAFTMGAGGAGGGIGGMLGGLFSDRRLKHDIRRVGTTDHGLPIYTYKMAGQDVTLMGVMAQEVAEKFPKAVYTDDSGYLKVLYSEVK